MNQLKINKIIIEMYQNNTPYPEFLNSFNTSPSF